MESPKYLIDILALRHKQLPILLPHFHAKEVVNETHVFHLKFSCKVLLARHDQLISTYQYENINIKNNDQLPTFYRDVVQVRIRFTLCEAQLGEVVVDSSVPSTRCLLQPIQSSLESAHMRLTIEGLKTFWLSMYTSSSILPLRKAVFTSILWILQPIYADSANIDLIDEYLATGEKFSS